MEIKIKIKTIWSKTLNWMGQKTQWILVFASFLLLAYCAYLWYIYISNPHWDEAKKQEYISTKERNAAFNKGKFDSIIADIENRKTEYNSRIENIPDIFQLK